MRVLIPLALSLILLSSPAMATTVTFQEGFSSYTGTQDATINTSNNNEHITDTSTNIRDNTRFFIVCWDISGAAISSSATVNSCTAQFYMDEQNCGSEQVDAHLIEDPDNTDPIHSNASGVDAFNENSTYRYKNETGTVKWEGAGGASSFADVDDNAAAGNVASGACPGPTAKTITVTSACSTVIGASKSYVCLWLNVNDGSGNVKISNKRDATAARHPLLTIDYTASGGGGGATGDMFKMF